METKNKLVIIFLFFAIIFTSCKYSEEKKFNEVKETFDVNFTTLNEVVLLSENLNNELKFVKQKYILPNIFNKKLRLRLEYDNKHYWIEAQLSDSTTYTIHESNNGKKTYLELVYILEKMNLSIHNFDQIVNLFFKTKIEVIEINKNKVEFIFDSDQFLVFTHYGIGNPYNLKKLKENWYYFEYDFL